MHKTTLKVDLKFLLSESLYVLFVVVSEEGYFY